MEGQGVPGGSHSMRWGRPDKQTAPLVRTILSAARKYRAIKKPALVTERALYAERVLNRYDIFSLGTFLSLGDGELDFLAFGQRLKA